MNSDGLKLLLERNSSSRLTEPAPDRAALDKMFAAAFRAPDHGWMRPWRFLTVAGDARQQLGQVFAEAALLREPGLDEATLAKYRQQPQRAPMLIVVYAQIRDNPKVPELEQLLATGCAAHGLLLAAEALGYAGVWRTGINAFDETVRAGLGLDSNAKIVGYLYLGTRDGAAKPLPALNIDDYVTAWGER